MLKPFSQLALCLILLVSFGAAPLTATENLRPVAGPKLSPAGEHEKERSARLAAIEKAVEEERQQLKVPGLSLVIVKDDQIALMKGFGLRDVEHNLTVTPDTLFVMGSCTKAFTAMALVMSQDEGKLSLDDSPKKFLPYFKLVDPEADANVTLRDLLCHRTGLGYEGESIWSNRERNPEETIKAAMLAKPTAKFRKKFQYNNVMFTAAGEAMAKAQNSTWEEVISNRIFGPLRMTASATSATMLPQASDFSFGYLAGGTTQKVAIPDMPSLAPAGAINSNARDLGNWLRLMLGGGVFEGRRLVSERGFKELVSKHIQLVGGWVGLLVRGRYHYGLGWQIEERGSRQFIYHVGGIDGFTSLVYVVPDRNLGFAVLCNVFDNRVPMRVMKIVLSNLGASS